MHIYCELPSNQKQGQCQKAYLPASFIEYVFVYYGVSDLLVHEFSKKPCKSSDSKFMRSHYTKCLNSRKTLCMQIRFYCPKCLSLLIKLFIVWYMYLSWMLHLYVIEVYTHTYFKETSGCLGRMSCHLNQLIYRNFFF